MKIKKLLVLPLVASIGLGATAIFANNGTIDNTDTEGYTYSGLRPVRQGLISAVSGEVIGINEYTNDEGTYYSLEILSEESEIYMVAIEENTVFIKDGELVNLDSIEEGMELTVHYKGDSGVIASPLILDSNGNVLENEAPIRVVAYAVVINTEEYPVFVHVDIFNQELVSSDHRLRLEISEDTLIVDTNNDIYTGTLENKKLAVVYSASSRSIPAIPLQPKIIVLGEAEEYEIDFINQENITGDTQLPVPDEDEIIPTPVNVVENSGL